MNRRKVYKKPEMEIIQFEEEDMIVTSGGVEVEMHGGKETELHTFSTASDWNNVPETPSQSETPSQPEAQNEGAAKTEEDLWVDIPQETTESGE